MLYRATVIVVEDDPLNRLMAVDALDEGGFEAVDFSRADEALAFAEAADRPVAALLTDVAVPGEQDGIELARQFNRRWPETLVLVTSGRFGSGRPDEVPEQAMYLPKPWRGRELVALLRDGLHGAEGRPDAVPGQFTGTP